MRLTEQAKVLTFLNVEDSGLVLKCCGHSTTAPLHSFGPAVRPHYLIHFILKGKGIEPDILTFYQADEKEPWEYLWVGFNGSSVSNILNQIGLSCEQTIFQCGESGELYRLVDEMLAYSKSSFSSELKRTGLLYQFLSVLAQNPIDTLSQTAGEYIYIKRSIEYIKNNYWDNMHIYDIANHINIDRSYLYLLFQKYLNRSPSEYLALFRLTRASELLSTTTLSIESISMSCGYSDPAIFSKAFKRLMKMSPSSYRKQQNSKGMILK
uniref:AraC family transcriptional regulator n=1 Tax=Enterocloster clostridioformis TaxID=1531 RepID=UPI0025A5F452|nr:AraC family transcriptional regulator [Enterocloster clostridioformis]